MLRGDRYSERECIQIPAQNSWAKLSVLYSNKLRDWVQEKAESGTKIQTETEKKTGFNPVLVVTLRM